MADGGAGINYGQGTVAALINLGSAQKIKGQKKKADKLQQKQNALMYKLAQEDLSQQVSDTKRNDIDQALQINDNANERGIGDSSIVGQNQDRRETDTANRLSALDRQRQRLESTYITGQQIRKINKRIAKAQQTMNYVNAFINGGALDTANYAASPQGGQEYIG